MRYLFKTETLANVFVLIFPSHCSDIDLLVASYDDVSVLSLRHHTNTIMSRYNALYVLNTKLKVDLTQCGVPELYK